MKCAIIMAGGKGTRMKATCPKVMCNVLFEPMISYVVDAVKEAGAKDICVITGYKHELLEKYLAEKDEKIETVLQEPQLGTGHALLAAEDLAESSFLVLRQHPTQCCLKTAVHTVIQYKRCPVQFGNPLDDCQPKPTPGN